MQYSLVILAQYTEKRIGDREMNHNMPQDQGLYKANMEKDNCGVGAVALLREGGKHELVKSALDILKNLSHRGSLGLDKASGDGSGIMTDLPYDFHKAIFAEKNLELPEIGRYAVGMLFLPREPSSRLFCEGVFERIAGEEGFEALLWREVPQRQSVCGRLAAATRPDIVQVFLKPLHRNSNENSLLIIRKRMQAFIAKSGVRYTEKFYICSLSFNTIVYKGLVPGRLLGEFYCDLEDERYKTRVALVHERYSTNTFPSWELAQPFRLLAHNGEINTLNGNVNWMKAREGVMTSKLLGTRLKDILPVIEEGGSDSACFDNALEFLIANGHGPEKSLSMMVPRAWDGNPDLSENEKAFYAYFGRFMEPWDGPASIIAYDGKRLCALRDKNGLRPLRYDIDKSGMVVIASESGVVEGRKNLIEKGGLSPGDVICFDLQKGSFSDGNDNLKKLAGEHDYEKWINENRIKLETIKSSYGKTTISESDKARKLILCGYSKSELSEGLASMADSGKEAIVSMGIDRALPALSSKNHLIFDYFKHRFAQVTNPPMDPIREKMYTSLKQIIGFPGKRADKIELNREMPFIELEIPVIDNEEMLGIKQLDNENFRAVTVPMLFPADGADKRLERALDELLQSCESCVEKGYNLLILSDRSVDPLYAPIPSLLALSALHNHFIETKKRSQIEIIVESAEVRDVSQAALLLGYGAKAVNPWFAIELVEKRAIEKGKSVEESIGKLKKAMAFGILKIIAKMGITTLQAYQGAKLFETVGLSESLVSKYFKGTPGCLGGIDLKILQKESIERHARAYGRKKDAEESMIASEKAVLYNSLNVKRINKAVDSGDYSLYKELSNEIESQTWSIRSILEIVADNKENFDCVETKESVLKRFSASAMSYGAISPEAHVAISGAMNGMGAISNSGEGGEKDDTREDSQKSGIRQIASGRFGVDVTYLADCREIEIKVAQGAKPGEGGHLPPEKVTDEIARVRNASPGISLISPPPHHDIYSIEDLAQLIHDLRQVNPSAEISVKLVASAGIGTVAAGVAKAGADRILISGGNGGTGAAPISSTRSAGIPWEIGLSEVHQTLLLNNLRHCVELRVDGKILTGWDIVKAAMLGAESYGFATVLLIAMGCRMCRKCQENVCPAGIATQDQELRKRFKGSSEHIENYLGFVARETIEILQAFGFKSLDQIIGRSDLLRKKGNLNPKAENLEIDSVLFRPELPSRISNKHKPVEKELAASSIDLEITEDCIEAALKGEHYKWEGKISNRDRGVGIYLSGSMARKGMLNKLKEDSVEINLEGSAGQSFGAFLAKGLTLKLKGDANDYVGKSLSGGKIVISPDVEMQGRIKDNMIVGNTVLYGASSGVFYGAGLAGDRFAVRNSGALAVCEGIGNNGCEYMTGGTVVVLGKIGMNFAAGMTGGRAYVFDEKKSSSDEMPKRMIGRALDEKDKRDLLEILKAYAEETKSRRAKVIVDSWPASVKKFKIVK